MERDGAQAGRALAGWKQRVRQAWGNVHVQSVDASTDDVAVGMELPVRARVHLGSLTPGDVTVQLYDGPVNAQGEIAQGQAVTMSVLDGDAGSPGNGVYVYAGAVPCRSSGLHGYSVRIVPRHDGLASAFEPGLVTWAS